MQRYPSVVGWSRITPSEPKHFIIEAIQPGIDTLDETGETGAWAAPQFFVTQICLFGRLTATRSRISVTSQ